MTDSEGKEYFFNTITKETTHDRPKPLPRYWREAVDKSSGQVYYWHTRSRAVRWERPSTEEAETTQADHQADATSAPNEEEEAPPPPKPREQVKRVLSFGRRKKSSSAGLPERKSQRSGEVLIKLPGAVGGQQFIIEECTDCDIFVLDWSATITVDRCARCRLYLGPCESSVFLRNCEEIRAVIACQQFRTRDVSQLDVLLLSVSQPSVEATSDARIGCFSFHYQELEQQMLKAGLSPFNNRWAEPYNFTPKYGEVGLLPPGTPYTALLRALSSVCPEVLGADEEPRVPQSCAVPRTVGVQSAAHGGAERGFLLVLPAAAPCAVGWVRELCDGAGLAPCALLRSREYTQARPDFAHRLLAQSSGGKKLLEAASRGRLIGLQLAGEGCLNELARRARGWNGGGGLAVYAAASILEASHMAQTFFEDSDAGQAIH